MKWPRGVVPFESRNAMRFAREAVAEVERRRGSRPIGPAQLRALLAAAWLRGRYADHPMTANRLGPALMTYAVDPRRRPESEAARFGSKVGEVCRACWSEHYPCEECSQPACACDGHECPR